MKLSFIIFFLSIAYCCAAQKSGKDSVSKWLTYTDTSNKFSLSYPSDWTTRQPNEDEKAKIFVRSPMEGENDSFVENINVLVRSVDLTGVSGKKIQESVKPSIQNGVKDFKVIKELFPRLNGVETYWLEYYGTLNSSGADLQLRAMQLFLFKNKTLYTVTFVGAKDVSQDYITKAKKILEGFKIINSK